MPTTSEGDKRSTQSPSIEVVDDTVAGDVDGSDIETPYAYLADLARELLPALGLHPEVELCIRVVDEEEMTRLHEDWMGEPGPTDVLSFPMDELRSCPPGVAPEPGVLGDIVICPEFVESDCDGAVNDRLELLIVHGMLHLLGWDHADDEDRRTMFELQEQLLDRWRGRGEPLSSGMTPLAFGGSLHESH